MCYNTIVSRYKERKHYNKKRRVMVQPKVKSSPRLIGAVALAKELGVTRAHLYKVVTGERQSRRLAAELKKRGIKRKGAK